MLPITRVNLQSFCRVCLCELSSAEDNNQQQIKIFHRICKSCNLKFVALNEFQRKTIFSTGILRLIIDDDKSKISSEALSRLMKYCRVCLRRHSNEKYNIRCSMDLCSAMLECTGLRFLDATETNSMETKKDAVTDDLRFPNALCNRCYATLKSFMEFRKMSKQTAEYLRNVLDDEDDESGIQNDRLKLKAAQVTAVQSNSTCSEELPVNDLLFSKESCQLQSACSFSDIESADGASNNRLFKSDIEINENKTSSSDTIAKQRTPKAYKPKMKCQQCQKIFRKEFLYEAHIKSVHDGLENAFTCPICIQSYATAKVLQRHISYQHKKKDLSPKYTCKYCEKAFKRNVRLKEHISTVHQKLKPFNCSICQKAFGTKNTLWRHQKIHSSEKPFSCEYCGKCYSSKSDLNVHIQRHTGNPELLCPICKRIQPDHEQLTKHIEKHSKAYQCTTCGKIFQKMVNLREHVNTVHLKQTFKCHYCNLTFGARKSLKNHELCHNSTNWPEVCVDCKLYFKSKHSFLIHRKKVHLL